jgi:cytochrome c biogenesis protein CcmG, thiol:disulfide interchange protein DsbE
MSGVDSDDQNGRDRAPVTEQKRDQASEHRENQPISDAQPGEQKQDGESGLGAIAVLVFAAALALFVWAWTNSQGDSDSGDAVRVGLEAPDFTLPDLDGNEVALSDYRGDVVLINFWATWCPPCRVEMPEMEAVYRDYRDEGFEILGVDQREPVELVESFVTERGFSWIFLLDEEFEVSREYSANAIPRSILVDRDGTVVHIWTGPLTRSALERQLSDVGIGS